MLCTVKCPLCNNWMSCIETPNGKPHLMCSICRFGFLLISKKAIENLNKSCQEIQESDLPAPTLEYYNKKVQGSD